MSLSLGLCDCSVKHTLPRLASSPQTNTSDQLSLLLALVCREYRNLGVAICSILESSKVFE